MEAVYVNAHSDNVQTLLYSLLRIKAFRDTLDILDDMNKGREVFSKDAIEFSNHIYTKSNINKMLYEIKEKNGIKEYIFQFKNQNIKVNINDFSFSLQYVDNIRFMDNLGLNKSDLKKAFIAVQIRDKEEIVYKYINEFDKDVLNFKIIGGDIPQCKTLDGVYRDLNQFGDGLKHFISIICSLYECSDGYLFIDEVDNGVHYTKLDLLWKVILSISKEQNVQIFATTHSKECIESYVRVAQKINQHDITYIKLTEKEENKRFAGVRDFELLEDIMEDGHEVRGW
jgi:AAA15 family ATPase/GTPase